MTSISSDTPLNGKAPVHLALRRVAIDTYRETVAYLHRDCAACRAEGFQALAKVEIRVNGRRILASLNLVDDPSIVGCDELGLSEDAFAQLGAEGGVPAAIAQAEPAASIPALHRKIAGERLNRDDFLAIMRDIAEHRYSKIELTAFVVACNQGELDREEVFFLTDAMIRVGRRLDWREHPVVDKHCIGGIPGNRTSMLVVPIVAAHGMLCPKTSSRAITSPAGTADTMEVLANVELPFKRLCEMVREERGCLAWGGSSDLSPADDVLIAVERPLSIDSPGQMVASILSKKIAAGSTHLLLDIPIGPTAKVRSMAEAQRLRKLFEFVATRLGLTLDVVITDGRQPIGNGIGPVLEARDVMQVLQNDPAAPIDLRQKALRLAGRMLEFDPDVRGGDGYAIARDILDSGRALKKMRSIIAAQGGKPFDHNHPPLARLSFDVLADCDAVVTGIDNLQLARIARLAAGRRRGHPAQARRTGAGRRLSVSRLRGLSRRPCLRPPGHRTRQRRQPRQPRAGPNRIRGVLMQSQLLYFDDEHAAALRLAEASGLPAASVERHRFPDDELRLRLPLAEGEAIAEQLVLYRGLDHPNEKLVELLLVAGEARRLGAKRLILVTPYLAYMRQDIAFNPGEVVSQRVIGQLLAGQFDALITVDPHLHRVATLQEAVPLADAVTLCAAPALARLIAERHPEALLIGPDAEALQWIEAAAAEHGFEHGVCNKLRHGDHQVEIALPDLRFAGRHVVLLDDVASSGRTLAEAAQKLLAVGAASVDVAVTHALFAGDALQVIRAAGVGHVWSTDCIAHESNAVSMAPQLAEALRPLLR